MKHAGYPFAKDIDIRWIDSSEVTDENAAEYLADVDGILVPGGLVSVQVKVKLVQLSMLEKTMYHSLVFV